MSTTTKDDQISEIVLTEEYTAKNDPVNHPKHYTDHPSGIECIELTEQMSFNLGNAFKYLHRADLKGATIQDLEKSYWYVSREIARIPPATRDWTAFIGHTFWRESWDSLGARYLEAEESGNVWIAKHLILDCKDPDDLHAALFNIRAEIAARKEAQK